VFAPFVLLLSVLASMPLQIASPARAAATSTASCMPAPAACRTTTAARRSSILLRDKTPDTADSVTWKWTRGMGTTKSDFGDPLAATDYALCLYANGALVQGWAIPAGDTCGGKPCWKASAKGFSYADKERTPDGIQALKLVEGAAGRAKITLTGKGPALALAGLDTLAGTLDVQMQRAGGAPCWGARFTPPFQKQDATQLRAVSDDPTITTTTTTTTTSTTTTTLAASWSMIQAQVIGTTCGGCHGGAGAAGLAGLDDCNAGHAALVDVAATELPTMARVAPGDPSASWIMHKLDGTHAAFAASCVSGFCGAQMPHGGPPLPAAVRDALRAWIRDGAVNDCP
jgi:hypothetical protein